MRKIFRGLAVAGALTPIAGSASLRRLPDALRR